MSSPANPPVPSAEKQKMLGGELFDASDPVLRAERLRARTLLHTLNATLDPHLRQSLLADLLGSTTPTTSVTSPFFCDYGYNIHLGPGVFLNFHCTLLDTSPIHIGADTQIGPNVQLYTADHPRDPAIRRSGLESGKPIRIGENVWIGGGAILLPGVTIGDHSILGAGSVITHDIPPHSTVAGNPARPITPRLEP